MFLFAFRPFYIPFIVIYCMAFYYSFTDLTENPYERLFTFCGYTTPELKPKKRPKDVDAAPADQKSPPKYTTAPVAPL